MHLEGQRLGYNPRFYYTPNIIFNPVAPGHRFKRYGTSSD